MFESTEIIGRNQFNKAKQLFDSARTLLGGPVDHKLEYVDMTNLQVTLQNGSTVGMDWVCLGCVLMFMWLSVWGMWMCVSAGAGV